MSVAPPPSSDDQKSLDIAKYPLGPNPPHLRTTVTRKSSALGVPVPEVYRGLLKSGRLVSSPDFADKKRGAERESDLSKVTQQCLPAQCSAVFKWGSDCFSSSQGVNPTSAFLWLQFSDADSCCLVAHRASVPSRLCPSSSAASSLSQPSVSQPLCREDVLGVARSFRFPFPSAEVPFTACEHPVC